MTRVVCIGVAVLDKIFTVDAIPPERTKVFARSYREIGGGPAATGAVTIARLGGQSTLLVSATIRLGGASSRRSPNGVNGGAISGHRGGVKVGHLC
jgi:hypothetical protein